MYRNHAHHRGWKEFSDQMLARIRVYIRYVHKLRTANDYNLIKKAFDSIRILYTQIINADVQYVHTSARIISSRWKRRKLRFWNYDYVHLICLYVRITLIDNTFRVNAFKLFLTSRSTYVYLHYTVRVYSKVCTYCTVLRCSHPSHSVVFFPRQIIYLVCQVPAGCVSSPLNLFFYCRPSVFRSDATCRFSLTIFIRLYIMVLK
jgi:hypothetical protein